MGMSPTDVVKWYANTYAELVYKLAYRGVPFRLNMKVERVLGEDGHPDILMVGKVPSRVAYWNPQIIFNWDDGRHRDVVVGCMHCWDDEIIRKGMPADPDQYQHPSIETYGFDFDEGDVTVFGTPEEAADRIAAEYRKLTLECQDDEEVNENGD